MFSIDQSVFKAKIAALITALLVAMVFGPAVPALAGKTGVISAGQLHVRLKPSKESRSTGILSKGTPVRVLKTLQSGWLHIESGTVTGYIRNRPRYVRLYKEKRKQVRKKKEAGKTMAAASRTKTGTPKDDIRKIAREIDTRRTEAKRYEKREKEIINDLHRIDRMLNQAKGEVSRLKKEIRTLDRKISAAGREMRTLKQEIRRGRQYITKRLVALYKMGRIAPPGGFENADSIYGLITRKMALARILDADGQIMDNYMAQVERLDMLKKSLETQKGERLAFQDKVQTNLAAIRTRKARRSELLSHVKSQKSLTAAAIHSLEEAARKLKKTLVSADKGIRRARRTKDSAPCPFKKARGRLQLPVDGRIVSRFGQTTDKKLNIVTFQNGINIKADKGEPIRAVEGGTVLFADWLKGYGNLMIINHGNSYYTLYAHADELFKAKGDMVENREVIATVGDTGLLGNPGLHFEIRHRGTPVDPLKWLAER